MAASAFHYVWPTTGILRTRLAACFILVMAERAINLAAPISFKHMVEVLSNVATDAAADASTAPGILGILQHGLRLLLAAAATVGQASPGSMSSAGAAAGAAMNGTITATPVAPGSAGLLAPFWVLFYPWAFIYLAAFFLRGGSGSEGLLANVRDILWIPITQVRSATHVVYAGCARMLYKVLPCLVRGMCHTAR